jgi:uncharacterized membrane protein (UPF0127 family)
MMAADSLAARNGRNGTVLGTHIRKADTMPARVRGLLGKSGLSDGEGLLIEPCSGVHTWFMRFPIDVVFLDKEGQVLRVVDSMPPYKAAPHVRGARSVLELPAGTVSRAGLVAGDRLEFEAAVERAA